PASARRGQTALTRDVAEGAVAVVAIEDRAAVVRDEQIDVTVVVVVAGTHSLSPAAAANTRLVCDVGEGAVALVAVQMAYWFSVCRGGADARAVDQKNIRPPIVVVVEDRGAATRCIEDVLLGA